MKKLINFGFKITVIITLSVSLGLVFNTLRPDSLPLVYAQESQVQLDAQSGEIALKDATLLFVSQRAIFLDARDNHFYNQEHIQGALSIPPDYFDYEFPKISDQLADKILITYCDGELCQLSHELAEMLKSQGLDNVYVLVNGWDLWKNENLPTVSGSSP